MGSFSFNERKENSQSFIMDVTCSYRMDLSSYIELDMLVDHGVACVYIYIYIKKHLLTMCVSVYIYICEHVCKLMLSMCCG